jgi:F0F1-type ATP synthase assembly protein I
MELQDQVIQRSNELKARVAERGNELRGRIVEVAERTQLVSARSKVTYELVSLVSGVLGGALAGAIFNRIWRTVAGEDEAPEPTALDRNIREVLIAGVLQGAVFGLVKTALSRLTARGYRQLTGHAPNR